MNDIGNYARHAQYWDWGGHDRTEEHEYWYKYTAKYGNNVLIPMCAWGEAGAYMARRGMNVTAFDITPEMIDEGKKHFGDVQGLQLMVADVISFRLDGQPADFCYSMDFGHILSIENIKKALVCINNHLRDGGGLVIETGLRLPGAESDYHPPKTFYPLKQVYPNLKVWKTGDTRNDAKTGRCYISQTFYAEDENGQVESFDHAFYLQSYSREEWLAAFMECGFDVVGEYGSREVESWQSSGDGFHIFEAVKSTVAKKLYSPAVSFDYLQ
jgi:SAM-dependent methyltransferase